MKFLSGLLLLILVGCSPAASGSYTVTVVEYQSGTNRCIVVSNVPSYSNIPTGIYCLAEIK